MIPGWVVKKGMPDGESGVSPAVRAVIRQSYGRELAERVTLALRSQNLLARVNPVRYAAFLVFGVDTSGVVISEMAQLFVDLRLFQPQGVFAALPDAAGIWDATRAELAALEPRIFPIGYDEPSKLAHFEFPQPGSEVLYIARWRSDGGERQRLVCLGMRQALNRFTAADPANRPLADIRLDQAAGRFLHQA